MKNNKEARYANQDRDGEISRKAIERKQLTFTLVEQDKTSVIVIGEWIKQNLETAPREKLYAALDCALLMREYPDKKNAD